MRAVIDHVAETVRRLGLNQSSGLIAVSGGPDSMALAHIMMMLRQEGRVGDFALAHVNHQLRGEESDADACFVADLARSWNLPVHIHVCDVKKISSQRGANLEATARDVRYEFFTQQASALGARWVATGHTADDQAETVLHRLLRGSGLSGIAGMRERRPLGRFIEPSPGVDLVRPLLGVRRAQILAYLEQTGQPYCTDRTNLDLSLTRNRLRHELLPTLAAYNPAIVEVLCQAAEQARYAQEMVEQEARRLLAASESPRAGAMIVLRPQPLEAADRPLLRDMLRFLWQREGWPMGHMDFEAWNRAADVATGRLRAADFPGSIHARRTERVVQIGRISSWHPPPILA